MGSGASRVCSLKVLGGNSLQGSAFKLHRKPSDAYQAVGLFGVRAVLKSQLEAFLRSFTKGLEICTCGPGWAWL